VLLGESRSVESIVAVCSAVVLNREHRGESAVVAGGITLPGDV
jgi:hypothetical protein